jgi:hypothetical protein
MNKKLSTPAASVAAGKVPAPVRVRLKRVNCDQAIPYPPDGQTRERWHRLKNAFCTASSAFVGASLQHLIAAARLPNSGISETAVNASLAFIEGAKPRDEIASMRGSHYGRTSDGAPARLGRRRRPCGQLNDFICGFNAIIHGYPDYRVAFLNHHSSLFGSFSGRV